MSLSAGPLLAPGRETLPPSSGSAAGERRALRTTRAIVWYLPAVAVFVGAIVGWELIVGALNLQRFVFPKPSAILAALQANWAEGRFALLPSALATLQEALIGLAIGTVAGLVVAFASARWVTARGILLPLAVAANAVPIIAFAPLLNNWFGLLNPLSKALMAAVLVFFPVMANVTRGLVQVEPASLELMRSYAASEWTVLRKVRIPNALPYFFTAMKVATTLSLIGAIVGEYFGGSATVLGRMIVQSASALKFDVTWAAILLGAATGIVFYLVVVAIERLVIPWHAAMRVDA
ncbi:MAG TPA: ABC transporter permease [Candidatus Limnocylindrales bacterium]|jgi:NitT/TauT family transport system permease protein|nr:ABC transporter permease [Candidatus Limnocylindrales bacterium]